MSDENEAAEDDPGGPDEVPIDNAASKAAYRRKVSELEQSQRESRAFWEAVFATPIGRRELWRILERAHALEDRFACGPNGFPHAQSTWFQAGEKAVGFSLYLSWLKLVPDGVMLMLRENYGPLKPPDEPRRRRKKKSE